jgi:hypothetical protein
MKQCNLLRYVAQNTQDERTILILTEFKILLITRRFRVFPKVLSVTMDEKRSENQACPWRTFHLLLFVNSEFPFICIGL